MCTATDTAPALNCEALETRENPDGNVGVAVFGNSLLIQGDDAGNHVRLERDPFGNVVITGVNSTTVNGQAAISLGPVNLQDVTVQGAGGADTLQVYNLAIAGTLAFAPGDESDRVDIGNVSANVIDVSAGGGNDTVAMDNVYVASYLRVDGGADTDLLHMSNVAAPAGQVIGFEQQV